MIKIDKNKVDAINERINPTNKIKKFNELLNQWDNRKQWYQCSFYAAAQNLAYNCWIILTEAELDKIAEEQYNKWKFDYTKWARWIDSTNAILKYLASKWKKPRLLQLFDNETIKGFIERWYIIMTWIAVSDKFKQDVLDWTINTIDYKDLKWNFKHYLNLWNWELIDNYWNNWKRPNIYACNIDEVLNDISQATKFIFVNY